jgi:predicted ATPase
MLMSEFTSAFSFFEHGISFLRDDKWTDHYSFSLEIHESAARCAAATGNVQALQLLAEEVLRNARRFEDTLTMHLLVVSSLVSSGTMMQALEKGLAVVSRLGENIPVVQVQDASKSLLSETQFLLRGITKEDFLNYRMVTDARVMATMKFLARLNLIAYFIKPDLQ